MRRHRNMRQSSLVNEQPDSRLKERRIHELDKAYAQHIRYLQRLLSKIKQRAAHRKEKET